MWHTMVGLLSPGKKDPARIKPEMRCWDLLQGAGCSSVAGGKGEDCRELVKQLSVLLSSPSVSPPREIMRLLRSEPFLIESGKKLFYIVETIRNEHY